MIFYGGMLSVIERRTSRNRFTGLSSRKIGLRLIFSRSRQPAVLYTFLNIVNIIRLPLGSAGEPTGLRNVPINPKGQVPWALLLDEGNGSDIYI